MRAILIDPFNPLDPVSEIEVSPDKNAIRGVLSTDQEHPVDRHLRSVEAGDSHKVFYMDPEDAPKAFSIIRGGDRPFPGKALVLGHSPHGEAENADVTLSDVLLSLAVFRNSGVHMVGYEDEGRWKTGTAEDVILLAPDLKVNSLLTALQSKVDSQANF